MLQGCVIYSNQQISNTTGNSANNLSGQIRGRGNSTWNMLPDKRPLRLRFDEPISLLNEDEIATDWILLADHGDRSLLRNYSALYFARRLDGLTWTPAARSIHLYVNDEYMGVYLLTDEREAVPINTLASHPDPSLSEYFFEMEWRSEIDGEDNVDFIRVNSHPDGTLGDASYVAGFNRDFLYEFHYPDDDDLTAEHLAYVQGFLTEVGVAIRSFDFAAISQLIDLNSLIDFYLVQELFKNLDAGFSSMYFQIRGQGQVRQLYHGPVWDFDLAVGNADWMSIAGQSPFGGLYVAERFYWYWYLVQMPEFMDLLRQRWNDVAYYYALQTIVHVQHIAALYTTEFERNFQRHDILGQDMWPSPCHISDIGTFTGHALFLIDFLTIRANYLDDIFNNRRPMW